AAERMHARPTIVETALDTAEALARRGAPGDAMRARALVGGVVHDAATLRMQGAIARAEALRTRLEPVAGARALGAEAPALAATLSGSGAATGPAAERARVNVTRAIRSAIGRIAEQEPELGHLLQGAIRTGSYCVYEPDPGVPLRWAVRS